MLYFFFIYFTIYSSNLSPATFNEVLTTEPPKEINEINFVHQPKTKTKLPHVF